MMAWKGILESEHLQYQTEDGRIILKGKGKVVPALNQAPR
jgi:hypothetical protein